MSKGSHPSSSMQRDASLTAARHPSWKSTFNELARVQQLEEDSAAWRVVCGELIAIVTGGVLLGVLGVLVATLY